MDAKKLIRELRQEGWRPFSYSGRFMFGKECVAVSSSDGGDKLPHHGMRQDHLGLDMVYYWPEATWPE